MARRRSFPFGLLILAGIGVAVLGRPSHPPAPSRPAVPAPASRSSAAPSAPTTTSRAPTQPAEAVLSLVSHTPPSETRPRSRLVHVQADGVNARANPDSRAPVVDRLAKGTTVAELGREGDWTRVRHPISGQEGWVASRFLAGSPPPAAGPAAADRPAAQPNPTDLSTAVIVARLLAESRSSYGGSCACPDDVDRGGRRCGGRSAYSRPGGAQPLCYPTDVTKTMIDQYRSRLASR